MKTGVLLLHGLTGVPSEMRPVQKYLEKLGYETEAPALAGHDGTNDELLDARWIDWVAGAQSALDSLFTRVDQVVLCGLSMGASICGILASQGDVRIKGLIMMSPTLEYDSPSLDNDVFLKVCKSKAVRIALQKITTAVPVLGRKLYWTESPPYGLKDVRLQRQITKAIEAAKRGEETKFGLFRTYFASLREMYSTNWDFQAKAGKIACPTLIISSLEDTLVSIENATNTFNLLGRASYKSMAMLTGCDHVLTLDLQRNYVCRLIGEFMETLTGKPMDPNINDALGELTVEVHNRLNPLVDDDWLRLVPGGRPLPDLLPLLQRRQVHESACFTLVVRYKNEPVLMLPSFIQEQQIVAFGRQQKCRVLTVAVPEHFIDNKMYSSVSDEVNKQCWDQAKRTLSALSRSYGARITAFLQPDFQATVAGSSESFSMAPRLQRNTSIIETPPAGADSQLEGTLLASVECTGVGAP